MGINKAVFVTNVPGDHIRTYINPTIESLSGMDIRTEEGCISFPEKALTTIRKRHTRVHAFNLKGEQFIIDTSSPIFTHKAGAFLSAVIQHEYEHMLGIDMREYL